MADPMSGEWHLAVRTGSHAERCSEFRTAGTDKCAGPQRTICSTPLLIPPETAPRSVWCWHYSKRSTDIHSTRLFLTCALRRNTRSRLHPSPSGQCMTD